MTDKSTAKVGQALQNIADNEDDSEELFYDPHSGRLDVAKKGQVVQDLDRIPATQMAREGYFR